MWWVLSATATSWDIPGDFPTISAAVQSGVVTSGDRLDLGPGTFVGVELPTNLDLEIRGSGTGTTTVVAPPGSLGGDWVFRTQLNGALALESLTIDGAGSAGGIDLRNDSTLALVDVEIVAGFANEGGCINAESATITLQTVELLGCTAGQHGGAIFAKSTQVTADDVIFLSNTSGDGGAIYLKDSSGLTLTSSYFADNHAISGNGGTVYCQSSGTVCVLDDFQLDSGTTDQRGGGVYADNATVFISGGLFTQNVANRGGAIAGRAAVVDVQRSRFLWNESYTEGGAIHVDGQGSLYARNAYFCQNVSTTGHALANTSGAATVDVQNALFVQNGVPTPLDYAVTLRSGSVFAHNTFIGDLGESVNTGGATVEDNIFTGSPNEVLDSTALAPPVRNNVVWDGYIYGTIDASQQIFEDPGIVGYAGTDCGTLDDAYATAAAILDVSTSGRLDIDGTVADAGHFGGPDLDTAFWYADLDGDGVHKGLDCDDSNPSVYPGAVEILCNGIDEDCGGSPDSADADSDGYTTCAGDCNDLDPAVNPGATEVSCNGKDDDCNSATPDGPDGDGDGVAACLDCDDADPARFPGNPETCDGVDNDCDLAIDNGVTATDWYVDGDGDGFGDAFDSSSCQQPAGTSATSTDCDDTNAAVYPGAPETCDGADNDCDGLTDDADPGVVASRFYADLDDDNFGDDTDPGSIACSQPAGTAIVQGDCNDADPTIFPLAVEACPDGIDNDCDGLVDTDDPDYTDQPVVFWFDQDGDGTGTPSATFMGCSGDQPLGYVSPALGEDCDDGDFTVSPLIGEICDGIDNDCSGVPDDGLSFADFYPDTDGDGFGDPTGTPVNSCEPVPGYSVDATDCDDTRGIQFPGNPEVCDNLDNDCNGAADDGLPVAWWYPDADGDGYGNEATGVETCLAIPGWIATGGDCDDGDASVNPAAVEDPDDGIDNDCDGEGFVPTDTGDTGTEPLLDSDGDGVPDALDPDPFSVGDGEGVLPEPVAGCGCSSSPAPIVPVFALLASIVFQRRSTRMR
ncbi:MAG: MopE-related protein [Myxococcota bacterium]